MDDILFRNELNLKHLNQKNCLTGKDGWKIYYFNDNLKITGNCLKVFPIFCSDYSRSRVCKLEELNIEDNKLEKIIKRDLILLKSLKYLNLNQNLISKIENNTFDQQMKLEKLILSCNSLTSDMLDSNPFIFKHLFNLKELIYLIYSTS